MKREQGLKNARDQGAKGENVKGAVTYNGFTFYFLSYSFFSPK